ncbi:MAG: DUF2877 domain-containing protein [Nocardioidaceae bacterium]|nr:DUF2877 domain-containing protein [Nocardioidaceae bacterium]
MTLPVPGLRPCAVGHGQRRPRSRKGASTVRPTTSPAPAPRPAWCSLALRELLLGAPGHGRVRWETRSACYAEVRSHGRDQLVALLAPDAVRVPMGVVLDSRRLPRTGTDVHVGAGTIGYGARSWHAARWWDPRPRVNGAVLATRGEVLERAVGLQPEASFGLPLADEMSIGAALARGDVRAATAVIGLGPGLTPSGDDVVAGALAVLALVSRLDDATARAVLDRARTHTTALSTALLEAATQGQMIPQAARLLEAVAAAAPQPHIDARADELFAVGGHSGHDLAAGMLGALVGAP